MQRKQRKQSNIINEHCDIYERSWQCGGGGHFLGDEGSAWDVAIGTIRKVFQLEELLK